MGKWTQFSTREKIAVFIASLIFVGSVTLLVKFEDIFMKAEIDPRDVVGEMLSTFGDMKRRVPDRFEFLTILKGSVVGNGDTLFSGKRSRGAVRLDEQNIISLEEETLIVIRKRENGYNIQVKKGNISGTIDEKSILEFQTDEESLILDGKEVSEFTLRYLPQFGLSLGSVDMTRNLRKKGPASQNKEDAAKVTNTKNPDKEQGKSSSQGFEENLSQSREVIPESSKQMIHLADKEAKKGLRKKSPIIIGGVSYSAPYPRQDQVLFFKGSTSFILLPKVKCWESCLISVRINGHSLFEKRFAPGKVPVIRFPFAENTSGEVAWNLSDGSEQVQGRFRIEKFSETAFAKALREKRDIEVLN